MNSAFEDQQSSEFCWCPLRLIGEFSLLSSVPKHTTSDMDRSEKNMDDIAQTTRTITESVHDEKLHTAGHENYHGIDTRALHLGADEVYEKKVSLLNEALIDIGMNSFQWKIAAMTGFGWFVDNVSTYSKPQWHARILKSFSSGCKLSQSSALQFAQSSRSGVLHSSP